SVADSSDGTPPRAPKRDALGDRAPTSAPGESVRFISGIRAFEPLQFREFRLVWLGQFTTAMGQWMDQVARGWLLYDLTGSPFQLGLVGVLRIFPLILFSAIAA